MYSTDVYFKSLSAVKSFVEAVSQYPKLEVYFVSDIYTIDAHSLIGILSLDVTKPITLEIRENDIPQDLLDNISCYLCKPELHSA